MQRPIRSCGASRVVQTHHVLPFEIDESGNFSVANIVKLIDDTASISVARHTRTYCTTASMDSIHFVNSIRKGATVTALSYVSGVGNTSVELFCQLFTEDPKSHERKLGATAFLTYVCLDQDFKPTMAPLIEPQTDEERMIHAGYEKRRQRRLKFLGESESLNQELSLSIPGVDHCLI